MLVMQSSWVRGKCIGQGAFGTAYLAVSNRDGRVFAVKSVDRTTGQPGQVEALENEIRILRDMSSSPHVVAFLGEDHTCERGKTASFRNLHMEYLPGGTVADVAGNGDVDERLVRRYAWCLTSALRDVHARGVVHCDVKGRNVLVAGDGAAKLADFGAAVEFTGGECCSRGSPLWMAPEVVRREYQGPESDVWSLGCTVIEMVTGKPAWEDRGVDTLSRIGFSDELPEFPGGLSELGRDFVEKCLRRDRSRRWSCDQLLQHPFLLPVESSPRCVMDWVDSRFSESETEFEDEEEVELSKEEENSVRERIGKLANVSRVNWESEGWVVVREVASDAEATMEKVTAACDEGECVGARWELGNVTRVEEEIEVGTSLEYSDSGGFGGERVNREMWEFGGGWKRWLLWRRECDQCNRNHRKDNITGGSCWRCRYEEKFNRIIILFTIYRLYCKIFNSCYLFSIYNYPFRLIIIALLTFIQFINGILILENIHINSSTINSNFRIHTYWVLKG
ncbi:mitogen-activated protein kinase kinase kinase 17-like [Lotus japonicus]|uniref:mitogen-activated protein kinase kinase kinase 17-like n=1 Tax=Lotus japonicus TaxID=34305 RepID=UPI00258E3EA1|nr:mitogen-activated protein kinase kinase kinase 17-like [Lotus japonicus]